MPSWPAELSPQQRTAPDESTAHACAPPATMSTAVPPRLLTCAGARRGEPAVASPTWPAVFSPQHHTAPAVVRAQANALPAATFDTGAPMLTAAGAAVEAGVTEPRPSWARWLRPQHETVSSVSTAHEYSRPVATLRAVATVSAWPGTFTAAAPSAAVPSWFLSSSPQHHTAPPVAAAHTWRPPGSALAGANEVGMFDTAAGATPPLACTVPLPIWPLWFWPQQVRRLSEVSAHDTRPPA